MCDNRKAVDLKLSLNDIDEATVSNVQREFIKDELNNFKSIKENDISISTSYIFDMGDKIEAKVFFRNGLNTKINFDIVCLKLVDEDGQIIASQVFKLRDLGDIPAHGARPYELFFLKENVRIDKPISDNWKVLFDANIKAANTVKVEYEGVSEDIQIEAKRFFDEYLHSLPLLEKGQVDLKLYRVKLTEDNKVKVTILIRNGSDRKVKLEKLPLTIYDKDKNVVYLSGFEFKDLEVNPLKARLYNFMVDLSNKDLTDFDLSQLSVEFKN